MTRSVRLVGPDEVKEMYDSYLSGVGIPAIGAAHGIGRSQTYELFHIHKLSLKDQHTAQLTDIPGYVYTQADIEILKKYGVVYFWKYIVIRHYGNKCKCGETIFEFLCIDHINNDGNTEEKVGVVLYREIARTNFPDRFQILCWNCNWIKHLSVTWTLHPIREKILFHYSNSSMKCQCCGYSNIRALTIDHINGRGMYQINQIGGNYTFYRWLISNNYPEGYVTLCHNCNSGKSDKGICPHRKRQLSQ